MHRRVPRWLLEDTPTRVRGWTPDSECWIDPESATPTADGSSAVEIVVWVSDETPPGDYTVTVSATAEDGHRHSYTAVLKVQ